MMRGTRYVALWLLVAAAATPLLAGRLTVTITRNGEPLADPSLGRYYVYEPDKRDLYVAWGDAARSVFVTDGEYDVVVDYRNGEVTDERTFSSVPIVGDVEQEVDFAVEVASLTVDVTSGGEPVPPYTARVSIHQAGRRGTPLASARPGERIVLPPGDYDVEIAVRDSRGLHSSWLHGLQIGGDRIETVEVGVAPARMTLTVLEQGLALDADRASWTIFRSGDDSRPLAERGSGETVEVQPGRYDIAVYLGEQRDLPARWLRDVELRGDLQRQVEIAVPAAALTVEIRHDGAPLPGAWFDVHPAGDEATILHSAPAGASVELEAGVYDVEAHYRDGALRAATTLAGQIVDGTTRLVAELDYRPATLRINPPRGRAWRTAAVGSNVLFVVDSSAAMRGLLGGVARMNVARDAIAGAIGEAHADLDVGIRAYGVTPPGADDCSDSTLLLPIAPADERRLKTTLGLLRPSGAAAIAPSLERAAEDLPAGDANTVVVVAGGTDVCTGDPCSAAAALLRAGTAARVHVVGLALSADDSRRLRCAGTFHDSRSARDVESALAEILRAAADGRGSVSIFEPGWGAWIASASLGEPVRVASGVYDLMIHIGSSTYAWPDVRVDERFEAVAGPHPR